METRCDPECAAAYKSPTQIARRVTEEWGSHNLYCAACSSNRVVRTKSNTGACDFICPSCEHRYELKSTKTWSERRVNDSGHAAMIRAIRADATPNLLLLHYSSDWTIDRLLLVPRFFFSESIIEKRKPLADTARRAGWVGCNILIGLVPPEGKIPIIEDGVCVPPRDVRALYKKVSRLERIPAQVRGWTLDVLRCVRRLPKSFALADVYDFEQELAALHPQNRFVRDKIRQQLQVLRDVGLVRFGTRGRYESM